MFLLLVRRYSHPSSKRCVQQIGIAWRLHHPSDVLLEDYGHDVIDAVRLTSYILAAIVTALMIPRLIVCIGRRFFTIQVVTMQEDSIDTYSR